MSSQNRPTASQFFDPLLKVLGKLTEYQEGVGVPYSEVLDLVLIESGIDPEDSPWPLEGSKPLGLYRIVGFAHRNQRGGSKAYSGKKSPTTLSVGKGLWGLTAEGVSRARELAGKDLTLEGLTPLTAISESDLDGDGDRRDDPTWVVLELTRQGESKVEDGTLEGTLRSDLDLDADHPVFLPALTYDRRGKSITLQLMEGYAFVGSGLPEVEYFALEGKSYVSQVMSGEGAHGMRVLSTIPNTSVEDMRRQLRGMSVLDLSVGDLVRVVEGCYEGLVMRYLGDEEDNNYAMLASVGLRSLEIVTVLPRAFLELLDEGVDYGFPIEED